MNSILMPNKFNHSHSIFVILIILLSSLSNASATQWEVSDPNASDEIGTITFAVTKASSGDTITFAQALDGQIIFGTPLSLTTISTQLTILGNGADQTILSITWDWESPGNSIIKGCSFQFLSGLVNIWEGDSIVFNDCKFPEDGEDFPAAARFSNSQFHNCQFNSGAAFSFTNTKLYGCILRPNKNEFVFNENSLVDRCKFLDGPIKSIELRNSSLMNLCEISGLSTELFFILRVIGSSLVNCKIHSNRLFGQHHPPINVSFSFAATVETIGGTIQNCSIVNNINEQTSPLYGLFAGLYNRDNSPSLMINNTIIADNTTVNGDPSTADFWSDDPSVIGSNNIIERLLTGADYGLTAANGNMLRIDPGLTSPTANTGDRESLLKPCSPAIDAGGVFDVGPVDIYGNPRNVGPIDIGAQELGSVDTFTVSNISETGTNTLYEINRRHCSGMPQTIIFDESIDGDTVSMLPMVFQNNVNLIGNGQDKTIIASINGASDLRINNDAYIEQIHLTNLSRLKCRDNLSIYDSKLSNFTNGAVDMTGPSISRSFDIDRTIIENCEGGSSFGTLYAEEITSDSKIVNSIISNNTNQAAGVLYNSVPGADIEIINSTLVDNSGGSGIGGIWHLSAPRDIKLTHTIIANNKGEFASDIRIEPGAGITLTDGGQNCIGDTTGVGSYFTASTLLGDAMTPFDPGFIRDSDSTFVNTYALGAASPCINGGRQDTTGLGIANLDVYGLPRIVYDTPDIGAVEYNAAATTLNGPDIVGCVDSLRLMLSTSDYKYEYALVQDGMPVSDRYQGNGGSLVLATDEINKDDPYEVQVISERDSVMSFNGNATTIRIPMDARLRPTHALTIAAWVLASDITDGFQEIYRKDDASSRHLFAFQEDGTILSFGLETTGKPYSELDISINSADYNNKWVHLCATFDGVDMKVYKDGDRIGSLPAQGTLAGTAGFFDAFIGSWAGTGEFFQGQMEDVALWKAALTPEDINLLISGITPRASDIIFWYDMNGHSNGAITSKYGGGIKGIIQNGLSTHPDPSSLFAADNTVMLEDKHNISGFQAEDHVTMYVDPTASSGLNIGCSWEHAYLAIDSAMMHMSVSDTILIAEGTYSYDETITVTSDLVIEGGHPSGGGQSNLPMYPTTLLFQPSKALDINAPNSRVLLQSLIIDRSTAGTPEIDIVSGEIKMKEVEIK